MKWFTKELKIALATIVAGIFVYVGINFLKGINLFQSNNTYFVKFKDVNGLVVSNPVLVNGYPVGVVRNIHYDYKQAEYVVVEIEINDQMRIPVGTTAELDSELMGGVKMLLNLGANPTQHIQQGDTLVGMPGSGAMAQLQNALPDVLAILPKLDSIVTNIQNITADPSLMQTLRNAEQLTAQLNTSAQQLNDFLGNDLKSMSVKLDNTLGNAETFSKELATLDLQKTINSVDQTLADVKTFSTNLNTFTTNLNNTALELDRKIKGKDNSLGLLLNDRLLYDNINSTIADADSLVIDLKAHPKRYVHFSVFGRKEK